MADKEKLLEAFGEENYKTYMKYRNALPNGKTVYQLTETELTTYGKNLVNMLKLIFKILKETKQQLDVKQNAETENAENIKIIEKENSTNKELIKALLLAATEIVSPTLTDPEDPEQ